MEALQQYLDGLREAYSEVKGLPEKPRNYIWHRFLLRGLGARDFLLEIYDIKEGSDLDHQFIKLAFFHQYPRWARHENMSEKRMLDALLTDSIATGEELLMRSSKNAWVESEEHTIARLERQYAKLHANERYADNESFDRLLRESSGVSPITLFMILHPARIS